MAYFWASLINFLVYILTFGLLIHVIFGWVLSPFHPAREFTTRLFEPLLAPIRQILPQTGMIDFSPMVLLILVQLIGRFLIGVL